MTQMCCYDCMMIANYIYLLYPFHKRPSCFRPFLRKAIPPKVWDVNDAGNIEFGNQKRPGVFTCPRYNTSSKLDAIEIEEIKEKKKVGRPNKKQKIKIKFEEKYFLYNKYLIF